MTRRPLAPAMSARLRLLSAAESALTVAREPGPVGPNGGEKMTTRSLRRGTLLPATLFMAGMLSGTTCSWDGPLGLGSSGGDKAHAEENNKAHAEESAQKAKVVSTGAVV